MPKQRDGEVRVGDRLRALEVGEFITIRRLEHGGALQARKLRAGDIQFYWRYRYDEKSFRVAVGVYDPSAPPKSLAPSRKGYSVVAAAERCRELALIHRENADEGGYRQYAALQRRAREREDSSDEAPPKGTPLGELIERYLRDITPKKKSAYQDKRKLQFLKGRLGGLIAEDVKPQDIAAYRDARLKEGLTGSTVNRDLASLSHLFEIARKEWGCDIPINPVRQIKKPRENRGRDRRLTHDEIHALLDACAKSRAPQLLSIVELAIESGMRQGELLALDWSRINLQTGVAVLPDTKNGEERRVPLSSKAISVLKAILGANGEGRVFSRWSRGDGLKPSWRRAVIAAGIADLRFHDLRHEATSRFFEKGLDIMQVAAITGHKTLTMLKRYTHLRAEDLAKRLG